MNIEILSWTFFREPINDYLYIYGEVQNQEDLNLDSVHFDVTGIDNNQDTFKIEWLNIYTSPFRIRPDETVPFIGYYLDEEMIITDLIIEVVNDASVELEPRYEGLVVTLEKNYYEYWNGENHHIVNVTIQNEGIHFTALVTAVVTLYDSDKNVVGVTIHSVDLRDLDINQSIYYEITTYEDECDFDSIDHYSIIPFEF
jgi:hypothetical protein